MKAVLKAGGRDKLIDNLGKSPPDGPDVDIVAIAFSAGDSFGIDGAELLAEEIRSALKHPEATRVIATLGFAVYERDVNEAQDGRCAARYLGLTNLRGQLDGLVIRPRPGIDQSAMTKGLGFPQLLASLAMASDPTVIQIDNPDANQLQRDFGRRLFAAGFADAAGVPKIEPTVDAGNPMNLSEMYRQAKQNLLQWHCTDQGLEKVWHTLAEQVRGLSGRSANWAKNKPKWLDLVQPPTTGGGAARPLEFEMARKVVAYIGHNGQLNAQELQDLRRQIYQDFPRARTVIYKYGISFSGHTRAAVPAAPVVPSLARPAASATITRASPPTPPPQRAGIFARIFGAEPVAFPAPTPNPPVQDVALTAVPPVAPVPAPPMRDSAPATAAPRAAQGPSPTPIAHFALFIVDTFQTMAFERLSNFVRNSMDVRPGSKAQRWSPQYRHEDIVALVDALLARSLLSQPFDPSQADSHRKPWTPPGLDQGVLRTCVRDSVLGGLDEEFQPSMIEAVCAYVVGERLPDDQVRIEAEDTADTVEEGATFLIEEAPSFCFTGDDLADALCGLNVICNEHLEPRKIQRELSGCLEQIRGGSPDSGASAGDRPNLG